MKGPHDTPPEPSERFSAEELRTVRGAGLFDMYLGRGWVRTLIIYGFPAVSALLIAAGIFSSFIQVSETLMLYSQPRWLPGGPVGIRIAVMDEDGEFVPVTELKLKLRHPSAKEETVLHDGPVKGTRAASLTVEVPQWPDGPYELVSWVKTTRRTKMAVIPVRLDSTYDGTDPVTTRVLESWKQQYGDDTFMEPGSTIRVEILPEAGQVASSLPNILYIRTTDASGLPVPSRVTLSLEDGYINGELPAEVETDSMGLATMLVYPTFNVLVIGVRATPLATEEQTSATQNSTLETRQAEAPESEPASRASVGRIVLPIGPQGIRLRTMVPDPEVGKPIQLRVYSVGKDMNMFTDLYRDHIWVAAGDNTIDGQSAEVLAPAARQPGLHVVQAYSSPVPVLMQKLPGRPPEILSATLSAAHVWVRSGSCTSEQDILELSSLLKARDVDRRYLAHVTPGNLGRGGYNPGQTLAFLLSRLDGSMYPPDVAGSSRKDDQHSASSLQDSIRTMVIVALCVVGVIIVSAFGFLTFLSWRASVAGKDERGKPETPLSSHDSTWLRQQVFTMAMVIAVVVGMFGLLTVLVAYLRWQMG